MEEVEVLAIRFKLVEKEVFYLTVLWVWDKKQIKYQNHEDGISSDHDNRKGSALRRRISRWENINKREKKHPHHRYLEDSQDERENIVLLDDIEILSPFYFQV